MYRQGIPDLDLYIEQDTERTPEPVGFYVFHGRQVDGPYKKLSRAQEEYRRRRDAAGYKPRRQPVDVRAALAEESQDDFVRRLNVYWHYSYRGSSSR